MIRERLKSFVYAFRGIATLVKTQPNAKIHFFATACVIILAVFLNVTLTEWAILALAIGSVWAAEALNTAIEFLADKTSPDWHELIEKTKDVAAAGVLLAAITALAVGLLIFLPYIFKLWR